MEKIKEYSTKRTAKKVNELSYDKHCELMGGQTPKAERHTKDMFEMVKHPERDAHVIIARDDRQINRVVPTADRDGWEEYTEAKKDEVEPILVERFSTASLEKITRAENRLVGMRIRVVGKAPQAALEEVIAERKGPTA